MAQTALVTGGSGYFGSLLVRRLRERGDAVRVLDLNDAADRPSDVDFVRGDIRDANAVEHACEDVEVVYHNVAQVPLARDAALFESVNVGGTETLLRGCADAGVRKVVYTSSSAVFGVPQENPVFPDTPPRPAEEYGRAKHAGELLCRAAVSRGLDVSIVRPRTILGHGRLGIFGILFDWIADGADVFVFGSGDNVYQFVHANDLAEACALAGKRAGPATYNIGAREFGTMRAALENLCAHAGTGSRVRSLPVGPAALGMRASARLGLTPFGPYHWIMYSKSLWFDTSAAERDLGWRAEYSTDAMFADSYDWFLANRDSLAGANASHHRSPAKQGALTLLKKIMR
ncbi:NAD-dependent epimerase/dehydratase family protein [Crossiella sp. CA198]|uniref:NAD-dependent epimerase/dehydratase family protein n=1 Tax=Crossiella sp. CA198 TaxID=3455607 RepID=UPI003F8D06BD